MIEPTITIQSILTPLHDAPSPRETDLILSPVHAGFPSPAEDYIDAQLDLNDYLIQNPPATFIVKVSGSSMRNIGIHHGDLLVVDRSITPENRHIVIAAIDGELALKRLQIYTDKIMLLAENAAFPPITIHKDQDFEIWGVVTACIKKMKV